MEESPHQRIRTKLTELRTDISNLTALPSDSTPGTIDKRQDLFKFLDDNVVALTHDIQQARPTEHAASSDHDDTRPEDGEQAGAGDDEVDGDEETINGLEKRISALYPSFDGGPLKARHFRDSVLQFPGPGSPADIEDRAFERVIQGYKDDTASWADKLKCLVDERTSWDALCDRGLINARIPEVGDQLIEIQRLLLRQGKAGCSELWVSAVIRMVEMIRFNKLWEKHDNGPGSRKWKGKFLRAACRDENEELYRRMDEAVGAYKKQLQVEVKERYSQFRRQHQRVIKAREPLVALYNQFGAAVFMDRAWDCENGIQRHSGGFSKLVDRLCEVEYDLKEKRKHNEASLKEALKVLASEKVVSYVGTFLVAYPCE